MVCIWRKARKKYAVQRKKHRKLHYKGQTTACWVYPSLSVNTHCFFCMLRLIVFMLLLCIVQLRLDFLHFFLVFLHRFCLMQKGRQEDKPDNNGNKNTSPPNTMAWQYVRNPYQEV